MVLGCPLEEGVRTTLFIPKEVHMDILSQYLLLMTLSSSTLLMFKGLREALLALNHVKNFKKRLENKLMRQG